MMEETDNINLHTVDVYMLQKLCMKFIEVKIMKGKICSGWVHSVDPVSKSLVLLQFDNDETCSEIIFIPGYNIVALKIIKEEPSEQIFKSLITVFKKNEVYFSKKELEKRREALCVWLSGNRVPYSVSDDLNIEVLQAAIIKPPYCTDSIHCKNEVVLDKVMKLVDSAPGLKKV